MGSDATNRLVRDSIAQRALSSAAIIGVRGLLVRVVQFIGTLFLARLLTPSQFGILAFGSTVLTVSLFVADLGLGAALVRRPRPPNITELRSLLGLELLVTLPIVVLSVGIAPVFGTIGALTAVMIAGLPVLVFRTPCTVSLERALKFKPIALAEVAEVLTFYVVAIAGVFLGFGVWSVAVAMLARTVIGTSVIVALSPHRVFRPTFKVGELREVLGFGARFQAAGLLNIGRDQGLNIAVAAIGGIAILGVWSLAYRILQIPFMLFSALWRVSYPAMSELLRAGENVQPVICKVARATAVLTAAAVVPLMIAGPPLVDAFLGRGWSGAAASLPIASCGLMVSGPISVATVGFLYASGDASTPLKALGAQILIWFAVGLGLFPVFGVPALALGWAAASLLEALILSRAVHRRIGFAVWRVTATPSVIGIAIGLCGWLVTRRVGGAELVSGVAIACASFVGLLAWFALVERPLIVSSMRLLRAKPIPATKLA